MSVSLNHSLTSTLMSDNKRDVLTRHKIIMLMGNTDHTCMREGAAVSDLEPICITYRLRARVFDALPESMLYDYNPPAFDFHTKPFCCMVRIIIFMSLIMTCMHYIKHNITKVITDHMHLKMFMVLF